MFTHILVPTDGSRLAGEAVDKGLALAKSCGARVTFLTVVEPLHVFGVDAAELESARGAYERQATASARATLAAAMAKAETVGVPAGTVEGEDDQPFQTIVKTAEALGCDLIAMASHGRRGLAALLVGSETTKVLGHSKVPVLVYR